MILDALPEARRCTWALALYASLRSGEIQGLRWADVDLTGARRGPAWDPKHHLYVAPKSKAGRRTVPVASVLRRQLEQHQQATGRDGDDLVVGRTAEAPMTNATALIRGRRACESAGVKRLGLHEARHTAVSLWIAAGMNLRAVSTYAGHASVAFTLDRYGHLLPDDQERAVELLDAFLGD
ncbi:MAG: site-specific integrase [Thermoleophilia bacterium]